MKKRRTLIICTGLIVCASLSVTIHAEGSWWDTGVNALKSLSKESDGGIAIAPSQVEIGDAFKQALRIGSANVVSQLGAIDGFNADPTIHIPLPEELNTIKTVLSKVGMSQIVDDLELKMNRAAEAATPKAKDLFLQAITAMTFEDIKNIYAGPEDSATKYFQSKMSLPLKKEMQPIVEDSLAQVGAIQAYDNVMGQYRALPFVPDVKANMTEHVLQRGLDGIFHYIAIEEASIRQDPVKQTTELLKKVFGGK